MKDLQQILAIRRHTPGILATVVHVEGSAYRRPGARMWIDPTTGRHIGTISGGCLEGDVARKAAWWTSQGDPVLRVYDTMSDEDAAWEFGLGCAGVIYILLERSDTPGTQSLLNHLDAVSQSDQPSVIATVVRASQSSSYRTGDHFCGLDAMPPELADAAATALRDNRSCLLRIGGAAVEVFLEVVTPPQRLVIFGAGHDAVPLVSSASSLGWRVTVADVRSGFTKPDRFPGASEVVTLPPGGRIDNKVVIDDTTAVVFMTHNLPLDVNLLPQVLERNPRYLGLLGPWKRTERLYRTAGLEPRGSFLHAPVGLDLGGDTPESIALSIVAEIQARLHNRAGGSLRWRRDSIHNPVEIQNALGAAIEPQFPEIPREAAACER